MNTKLLRITAMAAACAMMATAMCSCADGSSEAPSGDYRKDSHSNNNVIVTPDEEADIAEAPAYEYGIDNESKRPTEPSGNEEYKEYIEAGFKDPKAEPLSTFSADVDTASYSNVRRLIEDGTIVPEDAVRAEEFINYFDYDYPDPDSGRVFGDYVELADCPWNPAHKIMMIGIQGKRLEEKETPPSNLVFLIDSSGSMGSYDKLPLVQSAFSMLAEKLGENDRISIVTYAGDTSTRLEGAKGSNKEFKIKPSVKGCSCSLSGVENKVKAMLKNSESPCDIAKFAIDYINVNLEAMTVALLERHGNMPVLFAGGVSSNETIRNNFEEKFNAYFAEPQFSCDNAAGLAVYAYLKSL